VQVNPTPSVLGEHGGFAFLTSNTKQVSPTPWGEIGAGTVDVDGTTITELRFLDGGQLWRVDLDIAPTTCVGEGIIELLVRHRMSSADTVLNVPVSCPDPN